MGIIAALLAIYLFVIDARADAVDVTQAAPAMADEAPDLKLMTSLTAAFDTEVGRRLVLPLVEVDRYDALLATALRGAGIARLTPQPLLLVDRDPFVQSMLLLWVSDVGPSQLIGVVPISTGQPGRYEHFRTPLGVFRHEPGHPDFRAEGTRNDNGILGYGPRGARVFDFGWQIAERGWGDGGASLMRLQLHSTDPALLEPRLGDPRSKGCIRVPLAFNQFLDQHAILDADYRDALALGLRQWLWDPAPVVPAWAGRYLVVVDSRRETRPDWSPAGRAAASFE